MFRGEDRVTVQHERLANRFFLDRLFFSQSEGFRAITRTPVSRDGFVECKHTNCLGGGVLRILQTLLMIAGLDVVMGQLFHRTRSVLTP